MLLPEGDYRVRLHSSPAAEATVRLAPRDQVTVSLEKIRGEVVSRERRGTLPHTSCENPEEFNRTLGSNPF